MNHAIFRMMIFTVFFGFVSVANSKELLHEFKGSESTTTAEFEATAPWIIEWNVANQELGAPSAQVFLVDVETGKYIGKVVDTDIVSNGVRLFKQSGAFQLKIDSSFADWTLLVEQLTPQEAKAYRPNAEN